VLPLLVALAAASPSVARHPAAVFQQATNSRPAVPPNRSNDVARSWADTGATASVTGTVFDSVGGAPLPDAEVQLVDIDDRTRAYTVRADSLGRFRVDSMLPGRYLAGFFHPSLDALGIEPPLRAVTIQAGSGNVLELVIPGAARVMTAICGTRPPADSGGAMAGAVHDADSGLPISGARVVVSWFEIVIDQHGLVSQQRRVPVQTDENGSYRVCGLPGADTVLVSADAPGRRSGVVDVAIPVGGIARRDFTLGDSVSAIVTVADSGASEEAQRATTVLRGSARLSGIVRGPDAKPVHGARIVVWGTGLEATTREDGSFTLAGLPAGTFSVEARMLGFEPRRVAVDLSDRRPASVEIALNERVKELSRVVVVGKASRGARDIEGFLQRSRTGMGHYITAADNQLKNAYSFSDALRTTPGVQVMPSGSFGHAILLRGNCVPSVYLDGTQVADGYTSLDDMVPPQQVAAIEVYAGVAGAPAQYQSNGCGVILVWTKR
jgi:hypothetical protein